jgi:CelD/BcsL family acetyltransferase involved in cellulose biosynthesis
MLTVTELNTLAQLADLRLLWISLLAQTPGATFFQSLDWLSVYWRHFGRHQRLRVLLVEAAGQPIGILPLTVLRDRTKLGRLRYVVYPLHGWGNFFGPVGPNPTATLVTGLRYLSRAMRDWDVLELRGVDHQGVDRGRTALAMRIVGMPPQRQVTRESAQIDLAGGWEQYWASRTSHWRNNVRRSYRKVCEAGQLTYIRHRPAGAAHGDADPRWDLYEACVEIARHSWQAASRSGNTLSHGSVADFLRDAHLAAAASGALDLNLLLVGGQPAAFAYNYHYRGHVSGLRIGYNPAITCAGAGTVLHQKMIEDSCRRGDRCLDLGPDSPRAKHPWQTHARSTTTYTFYHPASPAAQALRAVRWIGRCLGRSPALSASGKSKE